MNSEPAAWVTVVQVITAGGLLVVMGLGSAFLTVGPADRAARRRKASRQFTLTDVFTLLVMLQFAIAPAAWIAQAEGEQTEMAIVIWVLMWIAAASLWWASVDMMARANVVRPLKRATFVLVVLPMALLGIFGGFALPPMGVMMFTEPVTLWQFAAWCAGLLTWIAVIFLARWLTFWIIHQEEAPSKANLTGEGPFETASKNQSSTDGQPHD